MTIPLETIEKLLEEHSQIRYRYGSVPHRWYQTVARSLGLPLSAIQDALRPHLTSVGFLEIPPDLIPKVLGRLSTTNRRLCWDYKGCHLIRHKGRSYQVRRVIYAHFINPKPPVRLPAPPCSCHNPFDHITNEIEELAELLHERFLMGRSFECPEGFTDDEVDQALILRPYLKEWATHS